MEYFTPGAALARFWRPAYPLLPWAMTSALLMVAGTWDHLVDGGAVEWTVVGLSAYELMMGLLATLQPMSLTRSVRDRGSDRTLARDER